jgi:hypothetical protein
MKTNVQIYVVKIAKIISGHRTFIIIMVACAAVFAALYQSRTYLNPSRNEQLYTEKVSSVNPKTFDQETLNKLRQTQSDPTEEVDSNYSPDRNNPFIE